jgi:hypothetical protein
VQYVSGTAAGTALADTVFCVAFGVVLDSTRQELRKEGLIYKTKSNLALWGDAEGDAMGVGGGRTSSIG